jgi:hypothetical protein
MNEAISEIHVFIESSPEEWTDWLKEDPVLAASTRLPHIHICYAHKRQTYQSYMDYSNVQVAWLRHGITVFVLANADIYFDETFLLIDGLPKSNSFFCITRMDGRALHSPDKNSQDVWFWGAPVRPFYSDFHIGIPGCDSRIAAEAKNAGLLVWNVGGDVRCHHLHLTEIRRYEETGERIGGPYFDVPVMSIEEVKREYTRSLCSSLRQGVPSLVDPIGTGCR